MTRLGPRTALTEAEQERIFELAALRPDGTRRKPGAVARAIGRSDSMVRWFMYRHGLVRQVFFRTQTGPRGRRAFSPEEDALILSMRRDEAEPAAIAAAVWARFGHERCIHTIKTRLVMLAGFEAEAEERQELRIAPDASSATPRASREQAGPPP